MIKEPYVSLKEIIVDSPNVTNIDESSILAGVINAPCGPDHIIINGPKQFLKEFTIGNAIPRNADITLINAYFCSFFAPLLVKRAWNANDGKLPIQTYDYSTSTMSSELISEDSLPNLSTNSDLALKYPVDLASSDLVVYLEEVYDPSKSYSEGDLVTYDSEYYQANAASTGTWDSSKWTPIYSYDDDIEYTIGKAIIYRNHIYKALAAHAEGDPWDPTKWELSENPTTVTSSYEGTTQWVVGITTPTVWDAGSSTNTKSAADFNATEYGFLPSELEGNDLYVIYWYDATLGMSATTDESAGYRLVSTSKTGINPRTGREVYFEDVLDDDSIPFIIESSAFTNGVDKEAEFGVGGSDADYNISLTTDCSDFSTAFSWFEDNSDVYNISYISTYGVALDSNYNKYIKSVAAACNTNKWFIYNDYPMFSKDISGAIKYNGDPLLNEVKSWDNELSLSENYRYSPVGSFDKNPSVTGWVAPIAVSSLILQRLYANKNSNSEFAPLYDATNGSLNVVKPYKEFNKSQREQLLNGTYPINWIKYDRTNNVYYMNDNRTHTRKLNVMNEEMNVRMVNKIQRDVMLLVQKYKGMLNNVELRLDVERTIRDYMDRYIMSQNYRPVEYRVVCDSTNNTDEIINANKLAIELDVRIQGSTKFIEILNKVFPLGVAFEE